MNMPHTALKAVARSFWALNRRVIGSCVWRINVGEADISMPSAKNIV
jgi:hypothetical protein